MALVREVPGVGLQPVRPDEVDDLPDRPRLRLVDDQSGEIICDDCGRARGEAEEAWRKLEDAEKELRQYRAKVRRLMNERAREREAYVRKDEVTQVFDLWRAACNHPRSKLTPDRFDAIQHMLELDYTVEEIRLAIAYVGAFPYVVDAVRKPRGKPAQRHDDIELICRKGSKLEKFANLGAVYERDQRRRGNA